MSGDGPDLVTLEADGWVVVRAEPWSVRVQARPDGLAIDLGESHTTMDAESVAALLGTLAAAVGWMPEVTSDGFRLVIPGGT